MLAHLVRSLVVAALACVTSAPLVAQIPVPPLPPLPPLPRVTHLPPLPGLEVQVSTVAPPRRPHERIPSRPGADHVWIKGTWHWHVDHWMWVAGRWERPHGRDIHWIDARYVREGRYWRYEPGHWSNQRVHEGDHYRQWKEKQRHGRDRDRDDDHDHDRHDDHGRDHH